MEKIPHIKGILILNVYSNAGRNFQTSVTIYQVVSKIIIIVFSSLYLIPYVLLYACQRAVIGARRRDAMSSRRHRRQPRSSLAVATAPQSRRGHPLSLVHVLPSSGKVIPAACFTAGYAGSDRFAPTGIAT